MLFFQSFVLKLSFMFGFINVVWNIQNWITDEKNKEMIRKDIIEKIIDKVVEETKVKTKKIK